jgi:hypothetical protein
MRRLAHKTRKQMGSSGLRYTSVCVCHTTTRDASTWGSSLRVHIASMLLLYVYSQKPPHGTETIYMHICTQMLAYHTINTRNHGQIKDPRHRVVQVTGRAMYRIERGRRARRHAGRHHRVNKLGSISDFCRYSSSCGVAVAACTASSRRRPLGDQY